MNSVLDKTVAELATENFSRTRVFERLGLDYCCKGQVNFVDACVAQGLDPLEVARALDIADMRLPALPELLADAAPDDLAANILAEHHSYLWKELPRLAELHAEVTDHHGSAYPQLYASQITFSDLRKELESHLTKEETFLFPLCADVAKAAQSGALAALLPRLEQHEGEHEHVGRLLAELREVHNNYQPPTSACRKYRALLARLEELELDTHRHIYKENHLLFNKLRRLLHAEA